MTTTNNLANERLIVLNIKFIQKNARDFDF